MPVSPPWTLLAGVVGGAPAARNGIRGAKRLADAFLRVRGVYGRDATAAGIATTPAKNRSSSSGAVSGSTCATY